MPRPLITKGRTNKKKSLAHHKFLILSYGYILRIEFRPLPGVPGGLPEGKNVWEGNAMVMRAEEDVPVADRVSMRQARPCAPAWPGAYLGVDEAEDRLWPYRAIGLALMALSGLIMSILLHGAWHLAASLLP